MSDSNNNAATMQQENAAEAPVDKGKGKATEAQDVSMDEADSSSDEEVNENEPVADEPDEDNMEEIDTDNIIQDGRRTRGRQIDFAKAAEELPEEDDEDDDDDFEAPQDEMEE
ncbi:histone chaperone domain chz [Phlyctema vagabunda]|uniref:Histone chaperone domain chz n=1 Tax=Phlyctema vagabunda TaxID=108571 RepID=A0ABR4P2X2_9HELO